MLENFNGIGAKPEFDKHYDNFFRVLYKLEPKFGDEAKCGPYIYDCVKLLYAADHLEAADAVRMVVGASLLRVNQFLWYNVTGRSEQWSIVTYQLKSPLLFRKAMIPLVGKFHTAGGIDVKYFHDEKQGPKGLKIWDLIVAKAAKLKDKNINVERHLIEWYPTRMKHPKSALTPGRAGYGDEIYYWQALTLLRQFFYSCYMYNYHHRASDGGLEFYRLIGGKSLPPWRYPQPLPRQLRQGSSGPRHNRGGIEDGDAACRPQTTRRPFSIRSWP